MNVFHLSAECYPAAKVGGLADVVGSLPKYLRRLEAEASVVLPKYNTDWLNTQEFEEVHYGKVRIINREIPFYILKEKTGTLGFPFYVVDIPQYFNREGIYVDPKTGEGYIDEGERFIMFQKAALNWIKSFTSKPDIIHCHDHHTGLVPFMMTQCKTYESLENIPTVLTVHNAEYQGVYGHDIQFLLPEFEYKKSGLLDWDGMFNSLAAGLKCCWKITTVSPSYMEELRRHSNGLELLFAHEDPKSQGILNGIDSEVWNPGTDSYLDHHYNISTRQKGKQANKEELCRQFGFNPDRPLVSFIGRLVDEKGADLLPEIFTSVLATNNEVSFLVLGTGKLHLHARFQEMKDHYVGFFDASLSYNEKLAHQIYAGSDFIIMPSRVEPCGLNQLYAMRYGTIPIVHEVGGLKDTVHDVGKPGGYGITFSDLTVENGLHAVNRALSLYKKKKKFNTLQKEVMELDYSWKASAKAYIKMYNQIITQS